MIEDDLPEAVARAHAQRKMYLQAIGTLVVRQLIQTGTIDADKLECAALDLRIIEESNGKFVEIPVARS